MRDVCARGQDLPEDWAELVLLPEPGDEPEAEVDEEELEKEGKSERDILGAKNVAQAAHDTWKARTERQKALKDASGSEMGGPDVRRRPCLFACFAPPATDADPRARARFFPPILQGATVFVCPSCLHLI